MPGMKFPQDVELLFGRLRQRPFDGHKDPHKIIQELDLGSSNVGPGGWYSRHDFSSFIGQQNLLDEPALESLVSHTITTTERQISRDWYCKYVLNSGSAPTTLSVTRLGRTDKTTNTMDSDVLALNITGAASAGNLTIHFYTKDKYSVTASRPDLDWLVGAIRAFRFSTPWTTTNITTFTATLELVKNLTGSSSTPDTDAVTLTSLDARDARVLVVGQEQPFSNGDEWDIRVKVEFVTTGSAATDVTIGLFAPQLNFTHSREPTPYAPERFGAYAYGGDGNDGNVVINSGTTTLTRDMYYNQLTVASGATLATAGYRVFAKEFVINNGTISCNGNPGGAGGNGSGGTGGTAGAAAVAATGTTVPLRALAGQAGTAGRDLGAGVGGLNGANAIAASTAIAGASGTGPRARGGGGGGKTGAGTQGSAGTDTSTPAEPAGFRGAAGQTAWLAAAGGSSSAILGPDQAGAGGGGGASAGAAGGGGGGSGSSGGIVWVSSQTIAGSGAFSATGGAGGAGGNGQSGADSGGGGGGSGGAGGWVIRLCRYNLFSGTSTVTGGAAGAKGNGRNAGTDGTAGTAGDAGSTLTLTLDPRQ